MRGCGRWCSSRPSVRVGTYLFAEVAVGIVYSIEKFGPSASILRVFAPGMFLVFIDMMFGEAIVAPGQAGKWPSPKASPWS